MLHRLHWTFLALLMASACFDGKSGHASSDDDDTVDDDDRPDDDDSSSNDDDDSAVEEVVSIGFESYAGECMGYCRHTLELNRDLTGEAGHQTWQEDPGRPMLSKPIALELSQWEMLVGLVVASEPPSWQESYGCPDCADQGGIRLTVEMGDRLYESALDPLDHPNPFDGLLASLSSLLANHPVTPDWICENLRCPAGCDGGVCNADFSGRCGPNAVPEGEGCRGLDYSCGTCTAWLGPDGIKIVGTTESTLANEGYVMVGNWILSDFRLFDGCQPNSWPTCVKPSEAWACFRDHVTFPPTLPPFAVEPFCRYGQCDYEWITFECTTDDDCMMLAVGSCLNLNVSDLSTGDLRNGPMCAFGIPTCGLCLDGECVTSVHDVGPPCECSEEP